MLHPWTVYRYTDSSILYIHTSIQHKVLILLHALSGRGFTFSGVILHSITLCFNKAEIYYSYERYSQSVPSEVDQLIVFETALVVGKSLRNRKG